MILRAMLAMYHNLRFRFLMWKFQRNSERMRRAVWLDVRKIVEREAEELEKWFE